LAFALAGFFSDVVANGPEWPPSPKATATLAGFGLCYLAAGVLAFWMVPGILLTWVALGFSLVTIGDLGLPLLLACAVSVLVAARCSRPIVIAHGAVCLTWAVLAAGGHRSFTENVALLWTLVLSILLSLGLGLTLRVVIGRMRAQSAKVRELEELNARIRRDERSALARELHDVVAHELTVITMQVMGRRNSRDPDQLREVLSIVDSSARSALTELRQMLVLLRDEGLVGASLDAATSEPGLQAILEDSSEELISLGHATTWTYEAKESETLTPTQLRTCSRIMQEAVTNIIKHAPRRSTCRLVGEIRHGWIHLRVENELPGVNGYHLNRAGSTSLGLLGLGERVDLLHGHIQAGAVGDQWVVDVEIPIIP